MLRLPRSRIRQPLAVEPLRWLVTATALVLVAFKAGVFPAANLLAADAVHPIAVLPERIEIDRPEDTPQLVVLRPIAADRQDDLTRDAEFLVVPENLATVDRDGRLRPMRDGVGEVIVSSNDQESRVPIEIRAFGSPPPVSFRHELLPLLTKSTCNSGGCHGKAEGQNGLKLSVFGFDPVADHQALVMEGRGRRVSPGNPAASLLYLKALAAVPHGGGQKIDPGSHRDRRLLRWIAEGATFTTPRDESLRTVAIEVEPELQVMSLGTRRQLRVTAIDASGRRRCVTAESEFESNAATIATVDPGGLIHASDSPGEAAILVRYAGELAVCRVTLPRQGVVVGRPPENNFVDSLVWDKLQRLGIRPSGLSDDATFLRRVQLDTIGTLPTPDEVREFLADDSPDKRDRLIGRLLERPEYVDHWTMNWLNLLKADPLAVSPQGVVAMQRWLRGGLSENMPFDRMVWELLTVQGNTSDIGPGAFYKSANKPEELARSVSQLFLGVRIECAECHHHPSERWGQDDFVGLAGFFTGLRLKNLPNGEQAILARGGRDLPHPRQGDPVPARALGEPAADFTHDTDRRRVLARWMIAPDNPYFARAIVNRLVAHYFGQGLIEPIDDLRETNPASNEPLMRALETHLRDVGYDLRAFTATLLRSRAYQASDDTNETNATDQQNFSHALTKSLPAEVLLDAICQATGVPEKFNGWPLGHRAIEVWDSRMPSYFFTIFGRPVRATVCECERSDQPSISQALHLLHSPEIEGKLSHRRGRARQLAESPLSPPEIITELYLATVSRPPTPDELEGMLEAFATHGASDAAGAIADDARGASDVASWRRAATEDVLWTLLNSKEFLFNH